MDREPRASTLFGARTGILANEIDTIKASRSISRCLPSSLFLEFVSLLADTFVRAAAGLLARGGHREVEPVDYRAPLRVMLHVGSVTRRVDRAGAVPVWLIFGRALRSCAAFFMLLRFGATSFVAATALRLLFEGHAITARVGRLEYLPFSSLVETRRFTAAPVEISGGHRWRVADDPMRHVLRMSAWNAMGWPERPALFPRWRPALSSVNEEGARASWAPSRTSVESPVGARWATREVFSPRLERVEEETTTVPEAVNELTAPSRSFSGRRGSILAPERPTPPTLAPLRGASCTRLLLQLAQRFGWLVSGSETRFRAASLDLWFFLTLLRRSGGGCSSISALWPLDGRCSLQGDASAAKMACRGGCGRTLHQRCADISKGYLLKGALRHHIKAWG
jgi:hypothetical protein